MKSLNLFGTYYLAFPFIWKTVSKFTFEDACFKYKFYDLLCFALRSTEFDDSDTKPCAMILILPT